MIAPDLADYGPGLAPQHAALLRASAINPDVARRRGYYTAGARATLARLGFGPAQQQVPALVVPVWGVDGAVRLHQVRPDAPRCDASGRPIKYETPRGARLCLDVPPAIRERLGDPGWPLTITEGARKVDAAVSAGLTCIGVLGVTAWRGRNADGGLTALPDWEHIALRGRTVQLAFDSDVMTKAAVAQQLLRLARWLVSRGADVRYVYLPPGPGGAKVGLDDFLAAGHTVADLTAHTTDTPRGVPAAAGGGPYRATPAGLIWRKPTRDGGVDVPLTTFVARIVADVAIDDGAETIRAYEIEARLNGRAARFALTEAEFAALRWPAERLGAGAYLYPGPAVRDHAAVAIRALSADAEERTVYAHTGWRQLGGEWAYLHAGGAIGATGAVAGVAVRLPAALAGYGLPDPPAGAGLVAAVRASLALLDLAPDRLMVPLLAAVYRAATGGIDAGLHLTGPTGAGKSELAALAQQHYGAGMDRVHLPAAWSSTGNALEALAFAAKDALLVVDDFCPAGSLADQQRYHREADRLLRAQGNAAGRQRLSPAAELRPARPPRGLILSTGEDVPRGQSLRARLLILEVGPDDLDFGRLAGAQAAARDGLYAAALAGYLCWLAGRRDALVAALPAEVARLRAAASQPAAHRRTPGIVAELAAGWGLLLAYAGAAGAITPTEAAALWRRGWAALCAAGAAQQTHQAAGEPARRFLDLLAAALAAGRAHLAAPDGAPPADAGGWGWRSRPGRDGGPVWEPLGQRIGWLAPDDCLYLEPEVAYAAAQQLGRETGDGLAVSRQTLGRRLAERGYLAGAEREQGELTVRRVLDGQRRRVWCVRARTLYPEESGHSGHAGHAPAPAGQWPEPWPDRWPDCGAGAGHENLPAGGEIPADGRNGRIADQDAAAHAHTAPTMAAGGRMAAGPSQHPATAAPSAASPPRPPAQRTCAHCGLPARPAYRGHDGRVRCGVCASNALGGLAYPLPDGGDPPAALAAG